MLTKADGEKRHWWEIYFCRRLPRNTANINKVTYELMLCQQRQIDKDRAKAKGETYIDPDSQIRGFKQRLENMEVMHSGVMKGID